MAKEAISSGSVKSWQDRKKQLAVPVLAAKKMVELLEPFRAVGAFEELTVLQKDELLKALAAQFGLFL